MKTYAETLRLLCVEKKQICFVENGKYHLIPLDKTLTFSDPNDVIAVLEKM